MRKRSDRRAFCNPRTNDQAEVVDRHAIGNFRVADANVRLDLAGRADPRVSFDDHTRVYHRVGADLDVGVDVGRGRDRRA